MTENLTQYWAEHAELILGSGYKILLSLFILTTSYLVSKAFRRLIDRTSEHLASKLDPTLIPVLITTATYSVYIIGAVLILDIFGVNTTSIIALLGAAGLAIGLALKDTLSHIAAGIMLLILRPFHTGDFIQFDSTMGTVREINLFTTVLESADGLYLFTPNSIIWGSNITNFTRNHKRRMDIVVGISYSDSIEAGLGVLRQIAAAESRFLPEPAPQVMVLSLGDSSVNLQLRGWASTDDYWQTYWDLNQRVKLEIEQAGLTIPFPQVSLHVESTPGIAANGQVLSSTEAAPVG
jgi:small conductance mechanosensitive channel